MNCHRSEKAAQQYDSLLQAFADERRRECLRILEHRASAVDIESVALLLVATEQDKSVLAVTDAELEEVRADLEHVQLAVLEAAGLVSWDTVSESVVLTDHPALADSKMTSIIETDASDWDDILSSLADRRRRILLSVLYRTGGPMGRTELATEVAKRVHDDETTSPVQTTLQQIHHVHLPKLDEAGLVTYDVDEMVVTYEGHPDLDEEWLLSEPAETPFSHLSGLHRTTDIRTIAGRDTVTERSRDLCESAEEELFVMRALEGTGETACLRRMQDALDRGVAVSLGTRNTQLRDLVREQAPAVSVWEPPVDWLHRTPERETVGRLLMADREEVLVGTVGPVGPDGVPSETGITGAGETNPLVVLVRQMFGSGLGAHRDERRAETPL